MVANPIDRIDSLPNKSSRYLSLIGFTLVGIIMLYIANEQVEIGQDLAQALVIIINRQEQAESDRDIMMITLNNTEKEVNNTERIINNSLQSINLTTKINKGLLDGLNRQNLSLEMIDNLTNMMRDHVSKPIQ